MKANKLLAGKEKDGKSYGAGGTFDTPKGCVDYRAEGLSHIIIR